MHPIQKLPPELRPPYGRAYFTSPQEEGSRPVFTSTEVGVVFFGRSPSWMYTNTRVRKPYLDEQEINIPRTVSGMLQFQLHDVERITHAFFGSGRIDLKHLQNALIIIKAIGENYHLI